MLRSHIFYSWIVAMFPRRRARLRKLLSGSASHADRVARFRSRETIFCRLRERNALDSHHACRSDGKVGSYAEVSSKRTHKYVGERLFPRRHAELDNSPISQVNALSYDMQGSAVSSPERDALIRTETIQGTALQKTRHLDELFAARVPFGFPHFFEGIFQFIRKRDLQMGLFNELDEIIRVFGEAFAACPVVALAAVMLKAYQLSYISWADGLEMHDWGVTLATRAIADEKVAAGRFWGWEEMRDSLNPVVGRRFLNGTSGEVLEFGRDFGGVLVGSSASRDGTSDGEGGAAHAAVESEAADVSVSTRTTTARAARIVRPNGSPLRIRSEPTIDIVLPFCCEQGIELADAPDRCRVFFYDVCGCGVEYFEKWIFARTYTRTFITRRTRATESTMEAESTMEEKRRAPPTSTSIVHGASDKKIFRKVIYDDTLTEDVMTGEVSAYFHHMAVNYDDLADVTLFLHPDYREHTRHSFMHRVWQSLAGALTWDFGVDFLYLGWRHESPVVEGRVAPHLSAHCPFHHVVGDGAVGQEGEDGENGAGGAGNKKLGSGVRRDISRAEIKLPCHTAGGYPTLVHRKKFNLVGDYNPVLLTRIWELLFQENLDPRKHDFGGFDFNQILVSRRAMRRHARSYYGFLSEALHMGGSFRALAGRDPLRMQSVGERSAMEAAVRVGGVGGSGGQAAWKRRVRLRRRGRAGGGGVRNKVEEEEGFSGEEPVRTARSVSWPSTELFISQRVDLTPGYHWNKGVCIWFEHLWHLLFHPEYMLRRSGGNVGCGSESAREAATTSLSTRPRPHHRNRYLTSTVPPDYVPLGHELVRQSENRMISLEQKEARGRQLGLLQEFHARNLSAGERNFYNLPTGPAALDGPSGGDSPSGGRGGGTFLSWSKWDDRHLPLVFRDYLDNVQMHKYLLTPREACEILGKCRPAPNFVPY